MPLEKQEQEADIDPEVQDQEEEQVDLSQSSPVSSEDAPPSDENEGGSGTDAAEAPQWQRQLEEAGFQSFEDIDHAVRALVDSNRQRDEQIRYYADQVKFYQQQQQFGQPSGSKPEAGDSKDAPSDPLSQIIDNWTDPSWAAKYIRVDEDGNRVIVDDADDEVRTKIKQIDSKLRQWQELVNDPRQFAQAIDSRVERMINERFDSSYTERQAAQSENSYISNFIRENASWLYARDPATGHYIQDPMSGQYVYSHLGNQMQDHMDRLNASGVKSLAKQIEIASQLMGNLQQAPQQPSQPTDVVQDKKNAMRGVSNVRNRQQRSFNGVSSESVTEPTGKNTMSWGEMTLASMQQGE